MSSASTAELRGGIDLGGTKIQAVVVDGDNTVLGTARHPTPDSGGPEDVAAAMADAMREAARQAGVETSSLAGVGVGSPGDVDGDHGTVTSARNLPDWEGEFALGAALESRLETRARLGNDVQVATDAEAELGAGRGYGSLLGVFWGTGVGGGIVLGGRPWVGRGAAGEIGHVVVRIGGERCGCGRLGCMEAYAGRASMERRARHLHEKGEKTDLFKIMDEAIEALGAGVASTQNVLDVEAIILGGGLGVRLGERYAQRIAEAMQPHLFDDIHPPPVLVAELGDLGGAIGAALLAEPSKAPAVH
ncbi:MAG: glucokinase [Solirubrobacteraceae bacterium]|nr:glucokinase [Solirubrobacteraceae bacterium]